MKYIAMLDDDADESLLVKAAFEEIGVTVQLTWFPTFGQLCSYLESCRLLPELLFLDINLTAQTGMECLAELKVHARFSSIPVIMYTNSDYEEHIQQCFSLGATAYVKKSSSFGGLKRNLKRVMAWNLVTTLQWPLPDRTILN